MLSSATARDRWELYTHKNYTRACLTPIIFLPRWKIIEAVPLKEADMYIDSYPANRRLSGEPEVSWSCSRAELCEFDSLEEGSILETQITRFYTQTHYRSKFLITKVPGPGAYSVPSTLKVENEKDIMDSKYLNPSSVKISQSLDISRRREPVTFHPGPGQCNRSLSQMMFRNTVLETLKIPTAGTKILNSRNHSEVQSELKTQRSPQAQGYSILSVMQ